MYKICFIAPSGYGKSTAISILKKFYQLENIKIAEPLYYLDIINKTNAEFLDKLTNKK